MDACWNCEFFQYSTATGPHGICRRRAPNGPAGYGLPGWGTVGDGDWCGEWAALATTQTGRVEPEHDGPIGMDAPIRVVTRRRTT